MSEKIKVRLLFLAIAIVAFAATGFSQNFTHSPKVISTFPTDTKSKEIKIKNSGEIPEVFIIYRYHDGQHYWEEIGSVSVFSNTEGKFYVDPKFHYGFNVEGKRPIKIGSDNKKWVVKYRRGEYDSDDH